MRIIFFGTPTFAATILEYLLKANVNIIAAVTKPDKKKGRSQKITPTPVKILAERNQIPVYQPLKARDPAFVQVLRQLQPDLFIVAAYSEIFNQELLQLPPNGCINVHASLLPKYRGAAPIERCIMAGEKESGVTIMKMVKELDAGAMYAWAKVEISNEMTSGELYEILSHLGAKTLLDVIAKLEKKTLYPIEQEHEKATYAHKLTSSDAEIDWNLPAETIHDHIRGLTPKPGAWCMVKIQGEPRRLLIKKTQLAETEAKAMPGEILNMPGLVVACAKCALRLELVQLEGKNLLKAEDFLKGIHNKNLIFIIKK